MAEIRKGHGFRVRCLLDDGTSAHIAIDMQGALDLGTLALVTKTFRRCGCGGELVMLGAGAPEPSETNAARKAHDESAASLVTQHCVRVKWGHSDDALRVLFADGAERTNRQIAEALKVSGDAVSQLLRRSTVVERVKHGVWRLRAPATCSR